MWTQDQHIHSQFNFLIQCLNGISREGYDGQWKWLHFEVHSVDCPYISIGSHRVALTPHKDPVSMECTFGRRLHPFPGRFWYFWCENDPLRPQFDQIYLGKMLTQNVFLSKKSQMYPLEFFGSKMKVFLWWWNCGYPPIRLPWIGVSDRSQL